MQQEVLEKQLVDKIKPLKFEQFEKSIEIMLHQMVDDRVLSLKNLQHME
jgi:phosphatidylglycerophosphatase A